MMNEYLLEVIDLHVSIGEKEILKGINLKVRKGELHAIFGPNGSGKTTFLNAVMGFANYKIKGQMFFQGKDITRMPVHERAKLGIGMSFQRPPTIRGVKLRQLIINTAKRNWKFLEDYARKLNLIEFLDREVNVGFSGGEIKRSELLQLIMQDPELIFLDEPESGVDIENIAVIGEFTNHLLGRKIEPDTEKTIKQLSQEKKKSGLIITHTGHILDYVDADIGHVFMQGKIACEANPREMLHTIKKYGFEECSRCFFGEGQYGKR
jgi:Fe-S cluster assembly ATP-binding protein